MSNFQDPPPPAHLRAKFFHTLDLGRPISNEPLPSPNDNQLVKRKHDPRMTTICYQQSQSQKEDFLSIMC